MTDGSRHRFFSVAELRDLVFTEIACPKTFCRLRAVSHEFARLNDLALESLYEPRRFTKFFFDDSARAVQTAQDNQALLAGYAVRSFIYNLSVKEGWLVIAVNQGNAGNIMDFVEAQGYMCYASKIYGNPQSPRPCPRAVAVHRFMRDKVHISVHVSAHEPLRMLLGAARPYAMQFCDGWRFCDLYPRLGERGPSMAMSNGQHAHLLNPKECLQHLQPGTFILDRPAVPEPSTTYVERWIGDGNTFVFRNRASDPGYACLERQGWTIRLNMQLEGSRRLHHFWTDTIARCLRHPMLTATYVQPPPAMAYTKRVLDRMASSLGAAPGERLVGPHGQDINDYDKELYSISECFRTGIDYSYVDSQGVHAVSRAGLSYEVWGF